MKYYILWSNIPVPLRFNIKVLQTVSSQKEATLFLSLAKAESALKAHLLNSWTNNSPITETFNRFYDDHKDRYNIISEEEFIIKEIIE